MSPTSPLPSPSLLVPGARTRTDSDVGILSIPVTPTSRLSGLGRTRARFTESTALETAVLVMSLLMGQG